MQKNLEKARATLLYKVQYEEIICLFWGSIISARQQDNKSLEEETINCFMDFAREIEDLYSSRKNKEMKHMPTYYHYIIQKEEDFCERND